MLKLNKSNKALFNIILKVLIYSTTLALLFSFISSLFFYKFDISLDYSNIVSLINLALISFCVPFLSLGTLKSSGFLMGIFCSLPLCIYSFITGLIFEENYINIIIRIFVCLLIFGISGLLKVNKNKRFKVK